MELNNRFIARQAILDKQSNCFGYELLYRDGEKDYANFEDAGQASMQVFDSAYLFGIEVLCGESKAFVNCTREVLTSDFISVLNPARTILEILETVTPDSDALKACARLKAAGYMVALDDFAPDGHSAEFLPYADIVKVELSSATPELVSSLRDAVRPGTRLLAECVETHEEYERASALGFDLFQGFYFCKPQVMKTKELSPSRINSLRLLQATLNEELKLAELEKIIKEDAALCYRLLRFINSVEFCLRSNVQSIRHALALLGERNTRRWALLTGTVVGADEKPQELLRCALLRAKLSELIAPRAGCSEYEGFLLGLLSLMAVILDTPSIATRLEIPVMVSAALAGKNVQLRKLLDLVILYESSKWKECEALGKTLSLSEAELSAAYLEAVGWVSKIPL